jgi:hypothetical protein
MPLSSKAGRLAFSDLSNELSALSALPTRSYPYKISQLAIFPSSMAIKNYTSDKPLDRIFAELQQTLGMHGAKQISYNYGDDGKVHGVQFVIKINDRFFPVKLPARVEKAQAVLKKQWDEGTISHKRGKENTYGYDQAYRVAWRNILDWVQAQMALLEIGMAKMEEVFLPYMLDREGHTLYERMEQRGFLLDSGKDAA